MKQNPLYHLAKIRQEKVEAAAKKLSDALTASARAAEQKRASERARDEVTHANLAVERSAQEQLQSGQLRAADLAQQAHWQVGADQRAFDAAHAVQQRQQAAKNADGAAQQARADTAQAKADADVVATLLEREKAQRIAQEHAQLEEAAEEGFLSRYGRSK